MRYMGIIIHIKVWGVSVWWGSPLGHSVWWESSVSSVDGGSVMVSWYWSCLGDHGLGPTEGASESSFCSLSLNLLLFCLSSLVCWSNYVYLSLVVCVCP